MAWRIIWLQTKQKMKKYTVQINKLKDQIYKIHAESLAMITQINLELVKWYSLFLYR